MMVAQLKTQYKLCVYALAACRTVKKVAWRSLISEHDFYYVHDTRSVSQIMEQNVRTPPMVNGSPNGERKCTEFSE